VPCAAKKKAQGLALPEKKERKKKNNREKPHTLTTKRDRLLLREERKYREIIFAVAAEKREKEKRGSPPRFAEKICLFPKKGEGGDGTAFSPSERKERKDVFLPLEGHPHHHWPFRGKKRGEGGKAETHEPRSDFSEKLGGGRERLLYALSGGTRGLL